MPRGCSAHQMKAIETLICLATKILKIGLKLREVCDDISGGLRYKFTPGHWDKALTSWELETAQWSSLIVRTQSKNNNDPGYRSEQKQN